MASTVAPVITPEAVMAVAVSVPVTLLTASTTFVPSQNSNMVAPLGMAIPVPEAVFNVAICPAPFVTMYILDKAGHITVAAPLKLVPVSVRLSIAERDSAVVPLAVESVAELPDQVLMTLRPAIASSSMEVILSFTTGPQDPSSSPAVGLAILRRVVYVVAI